MRALLLAAGVGNRLRPYTDDRPKPMLPIAGRPILGVNLAMLAAAGFDEVAVNLHYLPEVVRHYVGDGSAWGLRVRYSMEHELLGTAGALAPLADWLQGDTFAIVFGDNVNALDLGALVRRHRARGAVASIALWEREDVAHSGVAELAPDDRILRFIEKPQPGETTSRWVNAGVVVAEPALLALVPRDRPSDLGREILPALIARGDLLLGERMAGGHWWFDRVEDYERARTDPRLQAVVDRAG
ncbi:MAG: NDP-sugar synthase [Vulcanimicrobiaceae bacterium]|jgi:NDP-sugar pyrophosphorylase family protein